MKKSPLLLISALFAFSAEADTVPQLYNFTEGLKNAAKYVPEYSTVGLLTVMKDCALENKENNAGSESSSFGNVKITKELSSTFGDGVCTITFKNATTVNGETTDHSKICKISKDDLLKLLPFDPVKEKEENGF